MRIGSEYSHTFMTDSHVNYKSGNISETGQDKDDVAADH